MLSVLIVGHPSEAEPEPPSGIEILHARSADEAVEKLGRNRRIDAVLILDSREAAEIVEAIREDVVAPPPIFLPGGSTPLPGTRVLPAPAEDEAALFRLLAEALGSV
jgi:hypothetical protein